ncbi:AMP-binding protein [Mycobacterium sp. AMU20-3851]|uniref:class I adenylate-forming enzyme family protein n=1 Tax=Mycobacterium sp. AMU20-3851 TaxID=3122055 RepID=UPI0037543C33
MTAQPAAHFATMIEAWNTHVAIRPLSPAVHYFHATLNFAEIDAAASALAATLQHRGLQTGDRVAIYLQNDPQWLVTLLAAWKIGAVPVAVNPMLRAEELRHILDDSGARAMVCLDHLYPQVQQALHDTALDTVITTHPLDMTPQNTLPDYIGEYVPARQSFSTALDWLTVLAEHGQTTLATVKAADADDIGALVYTSGTTGRQKGAMNLQRAMVHNSAVYCTWWDLRADRDVIIGLAPVFHITGLIAGLGAHIISGAPLVLMHRFDAEHTLRDIERRKGTFMIGASTAFIALINHPALPEVDVSSLRKTPSGGAPVSPALIDRVRSATGWTLRGAYGLTETTSPTHLGPPAMDPPTDPETGATSVGVPVPGARVRIVDVDSGHDLAPGGTGEIVVSGPMVVPGYWRLPDESAHAIRDGWLHTGDIGRMTSDGWLFVIDRLKDLINAGGYKVVPRDVEDVLYGHPAVLEAAVIGVPDEYRGETVKAFVSLIDGAVASPEELIAYCRDRMAAYKYPRSLVILDQLPKNPAGKLLKRELRSV